MQAAFFYWIRMLAHQVQICNSNRQKLPPWFQTRFFPILQPKAGIHGIPWWSGPPSKYKPDLIPPQMRFVYSGWNVAIFGLLQSLQECIHHIIMQQKEKNWATGLLKLASIAGKEPSEKNEHPVPKFGRNLSGRIMVLGVIKQQETVQASHLQATPIRLLCAFLKSTLFMEVDLLEFFPMHCCNSQEREKNKFHNSECSTSHVGFGPIQILWKRQMKPHSPIPALNEGTKSLLCLDIIVGLR